MDRKTVVNNETCVITDQEQNMWKCYSNGLRQASSPRHMYIHTLGQTLCGAILLRGQHAWDEQNHDG